VTKQDKREDDKAGDFGKQKKGGAIGILVSSASNLLLFQFAHSFLSVVQSKLVLEQVSFI
jgi:hypothetical protein